MAKSKVYFSPVIDAEHLNKLYDLVKENISGKVAIKPAYRRAPRSQHSAARDGEGLPGEDPEFDDR